MVSIQQRGDRKFKITVCNGYRPGGQKRMQSRTIDVHVRTLRQKLGDGGALIKTIRNVGYMAEAK